MPEMHLRQPGVCMYIHIYIYIYIYISIYYQNKLDKACFQHDMAYGDFKDLTKAQLLIKCCVIKHVILLKIQNMIDINVDLFQWSIYFLIKIRFACTVKDFSYAR